jgi:hypothetical protein
MSETNVIDGKPLKMNKKTDASVGSCLTATNFLFRRETFNQVPSNKSLIDNQLGKCDDNSFYRKNLYAHFGCINAVEFSDDGSLLASGKVIHS